jgi:nitrate reductase (cytochrome)
MGFNQHTRGTWVNEQVYATSCCSASSRQPGNGAFSLTGQPSACGTAREVGTFAHRSAGGPPDPVPGAPEVHRGALEAPGPDHQPEGRFVLRQDHARPAGRQRQVGLGAGEQPLAHPPERQPLDQGGAREADNFIVVSEAYPGVSAKVADLILPVAMIFEKWGAYGNAERRTQHWRQQVAPPGMARGDLWQVLEFSKRFTLGDFWGEQTVPGLKAEGYEDNKLPSVLAEAEAMGYKPTDSLYKVLFATPDNMKYKWPDPVAKGGGNHTSEALGDGWFVEKALWQEYVPFGRGIGKDLADYDVYHDDVRGCAGRWSTARKAPGASTSSTTLT